MHLIESDHGYFLRRAGEERRQATCAAHPDAIAAHRLLADLLAAEAARCAPARPRLHLRLDRAAAARGA